MTDEYIANWLKKADNDLKVVEHELQLDEEETVRDIACYHCQQAVEKYIKAFLIFHEIDFPRTHSIEFLLEKAAGIDGDFSGIEAGELSDFGVTIRYPDDFYIPDIDEVRFYYELAVKIRNIVLKKISPDKQNSAIREDSGKQPGGKK